MKAEKIIPISLSLKPRSLAIGFLACMMEMRSRYVSNAMLHAKPNTPNRIRVGWLGGRGFKLVPMSNIIKPAALQGKEKVTEFSPPRQRENPLLALRAGQNMSVS